MLNEHDPGQPVQQQQASLHLLPTTVLEITAAVAHFLLARSTTKNEYAKPMFSNYKAQTLKKRKKEQRQTNQNLNSSDLATIQGKALQFGSTSKKKQLKLFSITKLQTF